MSTDGPIYNNGTDVEKGRAQLLERVITPGGHPADYSQPGIPQQHRKYGNPVPLGLTSFGTGFFLASIFTLQDRGITVPQVMVPVLILYGGITQSLCGWWEMFLGNTYSATIFGSYGAFNLTFGALYLPAFGVQAAYTNPDGTIMPQFNQAVGFYLIAWTMVTVLFMIGSLRSSIGVLSTLTFTALSLASLAIFYMTGHDGGRIAGGAFGMCATATAWWTAMTGFWTPDTTYRFIHLGPGDLSPKSE